MTKTPKPRRFNGKWYSFDRSYRLKSRATEYAAALRRKGYSARVVKNLTKLRERYWIYRRWRGTSGHRAIRKKRK